MVKRYPKTIGCDKCGHRIDHIPEKCPECGELIRDRMDPHVREKIESKLEQNEFWTETLPVIVVIILSVFCILFFAALLLIPVIIRWAWE